MIKDDDETDSSPDKMRFVVFIYFYAYKSLKELKL